MPPFSLVFTGLRRSLLFLISSIKLALELTLFIDILFCGERSGGGGGGGGIPIILVFLHSSKYSCYCFSCYFINSIIWGWGFYMTSFFRWWIRRSLAIMSIIFVSFFYFYVRPILYIMSTAKGDSPSDTKWPSESIPAL